MESKMSSDYPSDVQCYVADPFLWKWFETAFYQQTGSEPSYDWTEAEVHQWIDTEWKPASFTSQNAGNTGSPFVKMLIHYFQF
jgi:hypothetical protein